MSILLEVETALKNQNDYVFVDVRKKKQGVFPYEAAHIPQAVFLNTEEDLAGADNFLPEVDKIAEKLGALGINRKTSVVMYDEGTGRAAAKAWYIFYYLGHFNAYILQGGYPGWLNEGGETTNEVPAFPRTVYKPEVRFSAQTTLERLKTNKTATLIDARAAEKYRGDKEPNYHKAGHIPGAINFPVQHAFVEPGTWKKKQDLNEYFSDLAKEDELIVSCGSGNSACMNFVALKEAGYESLSLFPGGFREWIQDETNEVETGNHPHSEE
ncbi:MAG TPA: sulfurtransferase [Pseudogracilibacillus sp.]|nr:sulfurtransferase [Pseudogracilibacillus sp.]